MSFNRSYTRLRWLIVATLLFPGAAAAATFSVGGGIPSIGGGGCGISSAPLVSGPGSDAYSSVGSSTPVSGGLDATAIGSNGPNLAFPYFCRVQMAGNSNPGTVGSGLSLDVQTATNVRYNAFASATFDDFMATSNTLSNGQTVQARIALSLDGSLDTLALNAVSMAFADVRLTVSGPGVGATGFTQVWSWDATAVDGNPDSEFVVGGLLSQPFDLTIGAFFTVSLRIDNRVVLVGTAYGTGNAASSFENTLSFSSAGPVFLFTNATDVTVDSVSANVVGNQWTPVPEATAGHLLLVAGVASACWRRRRYSSILRMPSCTAS